MPRTEKQPALWGLESTDCFFELGVGRILESDLLGITAMECNDWNVKGFVGYKYPTYACCTLYPLLYRN